MGGLTRGVVTVAERLLFGSRYLLMLLYLATAIRLGLYVVEAAGDALGLIHMDGETSVLDMLGQLDATMVASAVFYVIAGSYLVYVKPKFSDSVVADQGQRPLALQHLSPGALKERMAASLIGVSSVNLLSVLLESASESGDVSSHQLTVYLAYVAVKVVIHAILIVGFVYFYKSNAAEEEVHHEAPAHA